jgi:DNA invertase Pin-like site-specific DNA recombinase
MAEQAYSLRAVAYCRVSTQEQADSRLGLEAQRAAVTAEAERRGWELVHVYEDSHASGKSMNGRPGLAATLEAVEQGEAAVLLVAKLDRLSRSLVDFAGLTQRAQRKGWQLVALDVNIDTTTAAGALVANVMASVAEWERRAIGERTAAALAVKKAQGVQLGRPREMSEETIERIAALYQAGLTVAAIARRLNEEGVPTPRGGSWFSPGVKRALSCVRT